MLLDYCNKRYFSTLTPTIYINTGCLPVSAVGVASRYDSSPKQLFIRCYWVNLGSTNRKAPAFLQGLLSLVRYGAESMELTTQPSDLKLDSLCTFR